MHPFSAGVLCSSVLSGISLLICRAYDAFRDKPVPAIPDAAPLVTCAFCYAVSVLPADVNSVRVGEHQHLMYICSCCRSDLDTMQQEGRDYFPVGVGYVVQQSYGLQFVAFDSPLLEVDS